jgi:hypothetical protein
MTTPPQSDPDFIPSQTQPAAGGDPDFIPSQTQPAAPTAQDYARQAGFDPTDPMGLRKGWEQVKGVAKGAARSAAGLVDVAGRVANPYTNYTESPQVRQLTDAVRARTQATNPEQEKGDFVESMLEFLPLMEEEGPAAAKSLAEKFGVGADLAKFADKYPKIASVFNVLKAGMTTAARAGAEQGAQTYVKTGGDVGASVKSAETGATVGGVLGAGAQAVGETGAAIARARPGARDIAGASFETRPTGDALLRNLKDVQQDPATQAVDEALGNVAKTGVANSINRSNAARAPEGTIIPPSRRLPGRGGFTVGPAAEPTPVVEGQTAFDPGKQQTGTRVVEGKGPGSFDLPQYSPELADAAADSAAKEGTLGAPNPQPEPQGSHREPIFQYRNATRPGSPEPGTDVARGPGTFILTDDGQAMAPERARQQLTQYDRILNDPNEVSELGVRQHQDIQQAREDLAGQLSRYDNYAASQPHLPPIDAVAAVRNTDSLGDAAAQLKAAHAPFWQAADQASGGEWTALREREKWLQNRLNSNQPVGNYDDLSAELKQNQQAQMDFFDKYKTTVSPQEWQTARNGYQDGMVLGNLDNLFQRKFGGISRELEQRGLATGNQRQRVFQPGANFNQQLEDFYNTGTNRQVLERTIGQDHMDSLHDLGLLFNSTDRMKQTQNLVGNIMTSIRHHYHGVRGMVAGGAGGGMLIAHQLGMSGAADLGLGGGILSVPMLTGTASGISRYIGEKILTDPSYLKIFNYALENGVPARTAGPLLAARLISQWQNQSNKQPRGAQPNAGSPGSSVQPQTQPQ